MKKHFIATSAAVVVATTLLSGGNGLGDTRKSSGTSTPSGNQTLIFGRNGDSTTLDTNLTTDGESNLVAQEIYESLTTYKTGTSQLEGQLATSWDVSPDSKTWTFHLRKGVKFQDGTPFNADAVIFDFNRWWDPKNPYHKTAFSGFHDNFGGYKGDPGCIVKDIKKVDDYTVRLDLTRSYAPLAALLTQTNFAFVSPTDIKKYKGDISKHPDGTGPFEFVSWTPGDKIVLQKNPNYWQQGLPKLNKVIFQVIKDNTARLNALTTGQIDLMEGLNPSDAATVKGNPSLHLYIMPSNNLGYLAFNMLKKPFDNQKVRQAISMVIDKQGLINAYYNGLGVPAVTPLPTTNWAFDSNIKDYPVNVQKAKQLLAEAGFPNGFNTELWSMPIAREYMPQPQLIGTAIQADLAKIGIKAKIVTYDWATYLDKTANGDAPMCLIGWGSGTWDPTDYLYTLLSGAEAKPPALNVSFYVNNRLDSLLIKALQVSDQATRKKLYDQAQEIIFKDDPMVPLVHAEPVMASGSYVKSFVPRVTDGAQLTTVYMGK